MSITESWCVPAPVSVFEDPQTDLSGRGLGEFVGPEVACGTGLSWAGLGTVTSSVESGTEAVNVGHAPCSVVRRPA